MTQFPSRLTDKLCAEFGRAEASIQIEMRNHLENGGKDDDYVMDEYRRQLRRVTVAFAAFLDAA